MKLAVIGAGWAGLACAVEATRSGHAVTVFEATRTLGGRARRIGDDTGYGALDNGQHILIGAYHATLGLMREVGVDPGAALLRTPLTLRFPDGSGVKLPHGKLVPAPLDLLVGILRASGWSWHDKAALLRTALDWRRNGFRCAEHFSVAALCIDLTPRVMLELIEPLCVSALNTPVERASGAVFLRVLHDALFGGRGGADLLLPRVDLGALWPDAAAQWLANRGTAVRTSTRVQAIEAAGVGWRVDGEDFDGVVLAGAPWDAARLVRGAGVATAGWQEAADALQFEALATVYATGATPLAAPMLALHSSAQAPAQFVFDRGQLGGPPGLLAFVVSANQAPRDLLQNQVLAQAASQLGQRALRPLQTVVEKRATFACTPGLHRPRMPIARGLVACGDYVDGPYPATLEGAALSGLAAARAFGHTPNQRATRPT